MAKTTSLRDAYRHPGFVPALRVRVMDQGGEAFVIPLRRRRKKTPAPAADATSPASTTASHAGHATLDCGGRTVLLEFEFRRVACPRCGVKRERLDWLADNPRYTRRFVHAVGRRCRTATIKDVAAELGLHWTT